jgi:hypothetical protein
MPYRQKLSPYLIAAAAVGFFIARWLSPLGLIVNLVSGLVFAFLTIIVGRRIFGRMGL